MLPVPMLPVRKALYWNARCDLLRRLLYKDKLELWPEHIARHTATLSTFSFSFHWRNIFHKTTILRRSVSSSAILNPLRLKHFPLTDIPNSINGELSGSQVRRMNRQNRISAALYWIGQFRYIKIQPPHEAPENKPHGVWTGPKLSVKISHWLSNSFQRPWPEQPFSAYLQDIMKQNKERFSIWKVISTLTIHRLGSLGPETHSPSAIANRKEHLRVRTRFDSQWFHFVVVFFFTKVCGSPGVL